MRKYSFAASGFPIIPADNDLIAEDKTWFHAITSYRTNSYHYYRPVVTPELF